MNFGGTAVSLESSAGPAGKITSGSVFRGAKLSGNCSREAQSLFSAAADAFRYRPADVTHARAPGGQGRGRSLVERAGMGIRTAEGSDGSPLRGATSPVARNQPGRRHVLPDRKRSPLPSRDLAAEPAASGDRDSARFDDAAFLFRSRVSRSRIKSAAVSRAGGAPSWDQRTGPGRGACPGTAGDRGAGATLSADGSRHGKRSRRHRSFGGWLFSIAGGRFGGAPAFMCRNGDAAAGAGRASFGERFLPTRCLRIPRTQPQATASPARPRHLSRSRPVSSRHFWHHGRSGKNGAAHLPAWSV